MERVGGWLGTRLNTGGELHRIIGFSSCLLAVLGSQGIVKCTGAIFFGTVNYHYCLVIGASMIIKQTIYTRYLPDPFVRSRLPLCSVPVSSFQ